MNPYKILGIKKKATKEEIKKAYKDLAKEHHPDKGGDEEKFKRILQAYQILMNDDARYTYDKFGMTPDSKNFEYHMKAISMIKAYVFTQLNERKNVHIEHVQGKLRNDIANMENEIENLGILLELIEDSKGRVKPIKKQKLNCYDTAISELYDELNDKLKERKATLGRVQKVSDIVNKYKTIPVRQIQQRKAPVQRRQSVIRIRL